MKKWILVLVCFWFTATVQAKVGVNIYEDDLLKIPFDSETDKLDVGDTLSFVISSDAIGDFWSGGLAVIDNSVNFGAFSLHDDPCIYTGAGIGAGMSILQGTGYDGYRFSTGVMTMPGDWFIFDYTAIAAGSCEIGFYDTGAGDMIPSNPGMTLTIIHEIPEPASLAILVLGYSIIIRKRRLRQTG